MLKNYKKIPLSDYNNDLSIKNKKKHSLRIYIFQLSTLIFIFINILSSYQVKMKIKKKIINKIYNDEPISNNYSLYHIFKFPQISLIITNITNGYLNRLLDSLICQKMDNIQLIFLVKKSKSISDNIIKNNLFI